MHLVDRECIILRCTCPIHPLEHIHTLKNGFPGPVGPPQGYDYKPEPQLSLPKARTHMVSDCNCEVGLVKPKASLGSHVHLTTRGPEGPGGVPMDYSGIYPMGMRLITVIQDCKCEWGEGKVHDHAIREGPVGMQGYP